VREERPIRSDRQLGRYGAEYRLTLIAAGSAVGIMAFIATRTMSSWAGLGFFTAILVSGWSVLLFLHSRAAEVRQRRIEGLRRVRNFGERLVIYDRETAFCADWYFRLRLQEELLRSQRFGNTCALLLVEATQGRLSPEREKELFDSMSSAFRETDLVAHLGSLRFVVLLPNIDADNAALARQRLLEKLPAGEVEAGIATYPADGSDWRELLTAAGASSTDFYGSPTKVWSPETASRFARRGDGMPA
jgi:GGDEF domain-containing protein